VSTVRVNIDVVKLAELVEKKLEEKKKVAKGTAVIVGNGSTKEFEVKVKHGLVSDKLVVSVSSTRPTTAPPSYIYGYLSDEDNDGFYETLVITIRFDTAPASGETVNIFWRAETVE